MTISDLRHVFTVRPQYPSVTITVEHRVSREQRVLVGTGIPKARGKHGKARRGLSTDALQDAFNQLDDLNKWRLVSYSTPETIMRDLTGRTHAGPRKSPESGALCRIGRMDMLDE